MALINVAGSGLAGEIRAFFRPAPQEQITCAGAKELVAANEFAGQRAVIVGGSRGLGEVAAKLLAAGGAEVRITYHQGGTDAERIVQEIASAGGLAGCSQLDVLSASEPDTTAALREFSPNALYYFATPFIFAGSKSGFSDKLFQRFCGYYVSGFLNVLNSLKSTGVRKIFHPSSTAVEELPPDMMEYAAAKMAAETVCSTLEKNKQTRLIIYKPRLPRLNTDQTVSLVPAGNKEPAPILLEHLRTFRDRQRFPGGGSQSGQT
jgi:NAD(P)-dependent dehydrogenase (short-subunit alcohol dehydrogenase family)